MGRAEQCSIGHQGRQVCVGPIRCQGRASREYSRSRYCRVGQGRVGHKGQVWVGPNRVNFDWWSIGSRGSHEWSLRSRGGLLDHVVVRQWSFGSRRGLLHHAVVEWVRSGHVSLAVVTWMT